MRSNKSLTISCQEIHRWTLDCLLQAKLLADHGPRCTALVVWNLVLRAAARTTSIFAACRDLAEAPCETSVFNALSAGLPKTLRILERRLNAALTGPLPRRLRLGRWEVAIDWHLVPYYGQPHERRNEIYYGQPRQGTKKFHAYATACIVQYGQRYTLALTWVQRHESMTTVIRRLLQKIGEKGAENQAFVARPGLLQSAGGAVVARAAVALLDACDVSRPQAEEGSSQNGFALDQAAAGRLAHTHAQERETASHGERLCGLSHAQEPQRSQTGATEAAVRRLASQRLADRNPRALSQTVWHRGQLPANAAGTYLHLHAIPSSVWCSLLWR